MKNFKTFLLTAVIALATTVLQAMSITELEILPTADKKMFVLSFKTLGTGEMNISLFDNNDHLLFFKNMKDGENSFKTMFDLSQLKGNNCNLVLEDDFQTINQPLEITATSIIILDSARAVDHKPLVTIDSQTKKMDINWLLSSNKEMSLEIKDFYNQVIYTDEIPAIITVNKRYDLAELFTGTYLLKLSDGNTTHYKTLRID